MNLASIAVTGLVIAGSAQGRRWVRYVNQQLLCRVVPSAATRQLVSNSTLSLVKWIPALESEIHETIAENHLMHRGGISTKN